MEILLYVAIGALVGALIAILFVIPKSTAGILFVDKSDPMKDLYRFNIIDLDALGKSRYVLLKVNDETTDSHE